MRREIIHRELSYKITGLLFKVHNDLGRYKNEKQYSDYFERLLKENNINYKREFSSKKIFIGFKFGIGLIN